ncbi:raffinose/stachyose/melibiose transport system permease protein [Clostridium cavendishii DSM 21758]|uniref:Raffinose/stachyose/melibiose transport system permease protein n=1 Tax=Clostridium cavendishii DSM 21758 TaxID=1121302 RepID=A0A1M6BGY2_9CLOT|nr:carbohydrate ABC transporter permease [Clostridium cavendishii]SHI47982.1 raffinose/stachyose/melibiose transport system permease protein [Clostridium cavendishii DSM 21758]
MKNSKVASNSKKPLNIKISTVIYTIIGLVLGVLFLSPFYIIFINSFKSKKELFASTLSIPSVFTFDNYKEAFTRLDFFKTVGNSLFITVISITLIIIFGSMAAWMLERTRSKVSNIIFFLFIASMLVPFQAVMLPLVRIMGQLHLLNMGGIIFMYVGFGASLSIFLYHGFVKSIPKELDEAAMIDGCNKFQTFFHIIFPLLKPTTITVAILNVVWIWNDFLLPSLVINKPGTQTIPLKTFFFFGEYTKQWNLALAGLMLTIIPVIIFYFIAQKHIIKSITAGSIK